MASPRPPATSGSAPIGRNCTSISPLPARRLLRARELQGQVHGMARAIGLPEMQSIEQELWTHEAMATAAIEGEKLELAAVRSSVLRHLGAADAGLTTAMSTG